MPRKLPVEVEIELNEDKYAHVVKCWNCGKDQAVDIPKGETVEEYADRTKCEWCGCNRRLK